MKEHLRKQRFMEASDSLKLLLENESFCRFSGWEIASSQAFDWCLQGWSYSMLRKDSAAICNPILSVLTAVKYSNPWTFPCKKPQSTPIQLTIALKFPNNLSTPSTVYCLKIPDDPSKALQTFIRLSSFTITHNCPTAAKTFYPLFAFVYPIQTQQLNIHFNFHRTVLN